MGSERRKEGEGKSYELYWSITMVPLNGEQ